MTITAGDVVRVAATGTSPQASVFQMVWHYKAQAGASISDAAALAAIVANYAVAFAHVVGDLSNDYSVIGWELWRRNVTTHQWDGLTALTPAAITGGSVSDGIIHGGASVGRIVTDLFRRQGRNFLPGWVEGVVTEGLLSVAAQTHHASYMVQFASPVTPTGGTLDWCTYNTDALSPHYETASLFANAVISNAIIGYQRRRKPLVGL